MSVSRWLIPVVLLTLFTAACAGADMTVDPAIEQAETATEEPAAIESEPTETQESATPTETAPTENEADCEDPFEGQSPGFTVSYWEETNFCKHSVPYSEITSGGPPPDGIPPIDDPSFVSIAQADEWLEDREPVIALVLGDDARAYPLQIMTWHEIVNDTVNEVPVVVTFCPLCNTGLVFERPSYEGERLTFGTTGNLRNSDLVMWDRQTESWWQQFTGEAIVGELTGQTLKPVPTTIIAWEAFKANHPDGVALSRETGFNRDYGRNPYVGYDDVDSSPFLFRGEGDDRLRPMERVVGVLFLDNENVAYPYTSLEEKRVIADQIGETPIVVFWAPGTASALDERNIPQGRDVGATGVFDATVDGETLTFVAKDKEDGTFEDENTGSTWNIFGEAIAGPLEGETLEPVSHHDTFWFAWAAFAPETAILE
jgi:hypothetical protein